MKCNIFFEIADWQIADCKLDDYRLQIGRLQMADPVVVGCHDVFLAV